MTKRDLRLYDYQSGAMDELVNGDAALTCAFGHLNPPPVSDASRSQNCQPLSRRESEVLYWLSLGKSGLEVAAILSISVPTVRVHIRNILRKLSASNIPHAVARGFELGVLSFKTGTPRASFGAWFLKEELTR